ncbi:hypothetical protein, partial [Streptomyces sp. NPDC057690]|uniref:hypothetical protein n=1 Tax=Streptomyces sp. NPDC057690 TaxID=3346214 RepID=UPI003691B603
MADENTSTTDVTDDSGSATDTDQHDDVSAGLGEAGQKALAAERKRAAVAERTAKASQKQLDEMSKRLQAFEDRDKTDAQKLTEAKTAAVDPADLPRLASGETVLFLAERSTSAEVQ